MKKMKILFGLLILVSLVSCGLSNAFDSRKNLSFHQVSSPLKAAPVDYDKPDSGYFHLVETANGKSENLFSDFYIADPQHSIPIYQSSAESYLLVYASEGLNVGYKLGAKEISDAQTGEPVYSTGYGDSDPPTLMKEPPNIRKVLSVSYNAKSKIGNLVYYEQVPENGIRYGQICLEGTPCSESEAAFGTSTDAVKESDIISITNGVSRIKEKYSQLTASFNGKYLYYDFIDNSSKPNIYKLDDAKGDGIGTLFRINARYPVVSDDDTIFAYSYSDKASFDNDCKWQTVIEKNGKQVKKFNTEQIVLMNEKGKTVYAIDPISDVVQVLDMSSFKIVATGNIDKGFIFPQIYNGKLQYTCPVYKDSKIIDYIVKEEGN